MSIAIFLEREKMSKLTIKKYQEYLENVYKNRNNDQGLLLN